SSAASARTPPARIIHQRFHGDFFCLTVKPPQNLGKDNVSNPWHTSLAHNLQWNNETGLPRNWPAEKLACRETGLPRQNLTQIRTKGQYHHQWDTRLARDADATVSCHSLMPQSHATVSCHSLAVVAILNPSLFSIQVFSQSRHSQLEFKSSCRPATIDKDFISSIAKAIDPTDRYAAATYQQQSIVSKVATSA
ncbi:MAG: hypothetical protein ACI9G1_005446, partial [Pirellulaceae bacterium]